MNAEAVSHGVIVWTFEKGRTQHAHDAMCCLCEVCSGPCWKCVRALCLGCLCGSPGIASPSNCKYACVHAAQVAQAVHTLKSASSVTQVASEETKAKPDTHRLTSSSREVSETSLCSGCLPSLKACTRRLSSSLGTWPSTACKAWSDQPDKSHSCSMSSTHRDVRTFGFMVTPTPRERCALNSASMLVSTAFGQIPMAPFTE